MWACICFGYYRPEGILLLLSFPLNSKLLMSRNLTVKSWVYGIHIKCLDQCLMDMEVSSVHGTIAMGILCHWEKVLILWYTWAMLHLQSTCASGHLLPWQGKRQRQAHQCKHKQTMLPPAEREAPWQEALLAKVSWHPNTCGHSLHPLTALQ